MVLKYCCLRSQLAVFNNLKDFPASLHRDFSNLSLHNSGETCFGETNVGRLTEQSKLLNFVKVKSQTYKIHREKLKL